MLLESYTRTPWKKAGKNPKLTMETEEIIVLELGLTQLYKSHTGPRIRVTFLFVASLILLFILRPPAAGVS